MSAPSRRVAVAAMLAAATIQVWAPSALASRGVALDQGRVTVEGTLEPGQRYQLGKLTVRNPGTERTRYELVVTAISTQHLTPEAAWFSFSPRQLTLAPGKRQAVNVTLRLPTEAPAGRYEALVGARVVAGQEGMALAAAAAARLAFTVAAPPLDMGLAVWLVPTVLAAGGVLLIGRSRQKQPHAAFNNGREQHDA